MNTLKFFKNQTGRYFCLLTIFFCFNAVGQSTNVFIVKFEDKIQPIENTQILSPQAIERRRLHHISIDESDYPVNNSYVNTITKDTSIKLRYTLRWQNAAVVSTYRSSIDSLLSLPFVESIKYVGKAQKVGTPEEPLFHTPILKLKESEMSTDGLSSEDYGVSYEQIKQIGVTRLHQEGKNGQGVRIAIFDAGFKNIHQIPSFMKHQANGLLQYGYDVAGLDNELNIEDNHGTSCASCFGGFDKGQYIGSSPLAHITLFRTEYAATEYPVEELNWCKAAELADSLGVQMITSSLGYNRYDDNELSYTHQDLDGETSYIAQAAKRAVSKGIFVINSAGNEGDNKWRKIGTPADVDEVLTVGASDINGIPGRFSSQGNNAKGTIKPDISACGVLAAVASPKGNYYRGYGTSYATPIAAGGVACLLQAFPGLNPKELADLIRMTASNATNPDSISGFGIARFDISYLYYSSMISQQKGTVLLGSDKDEVYLYTTNKKKIAYKLYLNKKVLGFIKYKKSAGKGFITPIKSLIRIPLEEENGNCSKKYTLKLVEDGKVGNSKLVFNDLSICPM